jgi:glycosyltransferase involved in cell wall biosynthesis
MATNPPREVRATAPPGRRDARRTRVLLLCPYPTGSVPAQRFRYEQYLETLREQEIDVEVHSFLDESARRILYSRGNYVSKALGVLRGFLRRARIVLHARKYDFVFLHREASPVGPPIFEWALFTSGCKVIFDFDDAIFVPQQSKANPFMRYVRCAWKTDYTARRAHIVSVCNPYLVQWANARNRNHRVVLIPTTIDDRYHQRRLPAKSRDVPVIGWTGSHSTARFLDIVRPALVELQRRHDFEFRVICDHDPGFPELHRYRFVTWRLETEIEDLSELDIGLMPVPEGAWERGKVGFKAIQYSALGIPSVVSAVGSGPEVVLDGETGYVVANDPAAWFEALDRLLRDRRMSAEMGGRARTHILKRYSVAANISKYVGLFDRNAS